MQDFPSSQVSQPSEDKGTLPAPYSSPWRALGNNLRAVGADLRLRTQEFWRRNWEGDLSVPAFWPQRAAALFWPALLAITLSGLILGGIQLAKALHQSVTLSTSGVEQLRTTPLPEARPLPPTGNPSNLPVGVAEPSAPGFHPSTNPTSGAETTSTPTDRDAAETESARKPTMEPALQPLRVAPILDLLAQEGVRQDDQAPALIVTATPQPERNALTLQIDPELWRQRSAAERQQLADSWWTRLEDQGYAELRLVNEQQNLLARTARVGGGMIVFDPERI